MRGDIDGLRYFFSQGLASPRDVSELRGYSLMRVRLHFLPSQVMSIGWSGNCRNVHWWALYGGMHQFETVKILLGQGALVDEE
ncbi:hypothetical protein B0H63DRAFT_490634 [Podospora didyma]|uniref:Uncharacterized protein n=1 Tax=Podospora didyma TaxID=330526 RepID=A0AAE0N1E7_9PEZI|nr:hypothetical protein B0H63DRAFT_490634 [Podospora didyma]